MGAVFRKHPKQEQPVPRPQVQTEHPAQGFDPRHLSTPLLVWCRADAGVESNGSTVSKWRDMGGRGRDFAQATAGNQPALRASGQGGRPEMVFDGSDDVFGGADLYAMLNDPADWTILLVVRGWSWGRSSLLRSARGALGAPVGGGSWLYIGVSDEAGDGLGFGYYNSGHFVGHGDDSHGEGDAAIMAGVCDSGDITARINGVAGSTVSGGPGLGSSATTLELGKGNANLEYWDGAISEVLIFDGALSAQDIGITEDYLADRYSVRMGH